MQPNPRRGYTLSVWAALIWALTSPGLSYMLKTYHTPALTLAFWRDALVALVLIAGLCLTGALRGRGLRWLKIDRRSLAKLALTGLVSIGVYHALWIYSIVLNGAALAVVLIYTYPTFVTLGARIFFGERIGPWQLAALAVSFVGCALLARAYDPELLRVSWLGLVIGIGTGITHAGYVLSSQRAVARHSPWVTLAVTMFFGSLALLALALWAQGPASLADIGGGDAAWWVLFLALGPTLGGYALFTLALQHIPGRIASLIVLIEAPTSAGLALLLLGERLEGPQLLGMALVLVAACLPVLSRGDQSAARAGATSRIEPGATGYPGA